MKKLWILGIVLGAMTFAGCGGSDKVYYNTSKTYTTTTVPASNVVPINVLNKFQEMFPAAHDVSWKVNEGLYKADFEVGDKDMNASFAPDGTAVKVNS